MKGDGFCCFLQSSSSNKNKSSTLDRNNAAVIFTNRIMLTNQASLTCWGGGTSFFRGGQGWPTNIEKKKSIGIQKIDTEVVL